MVFNFHSLVRLAGDLPMQIKELYSCALTSKFTLTLLYSEIFTKFLEEFNALGGSVLTFETLTKAT